MFTPGSLPSPAPLGPKRSSLVVQATVVYPTFLVIIVLTSLAAVQSGNKQRRGVSHTNTHACARTRTRGFALDGEVAATDRAGRHASRKTR